MKKKITILLAVMTVISLTFLTKFGLNYILDNDKTKSHNEEIERIEKEIEEAKEKIIETEKEIENVKEKKEKLTEEKKDEVEVLKIWEESLEKMKTYLQ